MNILVIGSGGREHAVIKSFMHAQSPHNQTNKIYCAPGNAGIAELATNISLDLKNHAQITEFCKQKNINFVFIGPEDPLVDGLADTLRTENISVFGPSAEAAQLEGSKIFAKEFMHEAQVPTAPAVIVTTVAETLNAAKKQTAPYILKADGLAAGKGVFICADLNQLKLAAENLFEKKILGQAGKKALLEQNLPGQEISLLVLTNGSDFQVLPLAQDHKRLLDKNMGPNTGGMGTVAPMHIDAELYEKIISVIVVPSINNLKNRQYLFNGVLFIGLMIVDNQPFVLEYNVRFGDPETQVVLPLIENNIADLFYNLSQGRLNEIRLNSKTAFCIVNAAEGYPDRPVKNIKISLPANSENAYILHAGTTVNSDGVLISNGGRVLNILAVRENFTQAQNEAYSLNEKIVFEGRQFRKDIGQYK